MARTFQNRRGLEKNLPLLKPGELAITTDTKKVFIGNENGNIEITNKGVTDALSTQLVENTTYSIADVQLSKRVTYDALSVKPMMYQAIINNPSGVAYTNKPVGIYVSFEKGRVINDKRLKVTDSSGTEIPCQWEDDIHPRTYESMGKWEDGSLKNGTVWIMTNLAISEQKTFNIQVIGSDTSYTDRIPGAVVTPGEVETLTANGIEFVINKSSSWGILDAKINGTDITGVNALQTTSIKNASYVDINSSQSGATNIISKRIIGSGAVFKEIVSKFSYVYEPNIVSTFRTRIWANGDVDWETRTETIASLSSGVLNGIMEKILWGTIVGATLDAHNHELYTAEIGTSQKILAGFRWAQRHGESYDTNNYPIVVLNSSTKAYIGWQIGTPNTLAIPKGAYWTQSAYVSFNFDTVANERLRRINRLFTRATNENNRTLKRKFNSYAKFYVENMRDWNLEKGENLFPGINGLESIGISHLSGDDLYPHAIDRFNNSLAFYDGGTKSGYVNAWKTENWRRGIQYIGRDMSILPYLYDEAKKRNDKILSDKILATIHNLADAFVEIESLSGGNGKVALRGDGNMASSTDAMNPEATAIKHINLSLKFAENKTRRDCLNRIIARFNSSIEYNTRLPYAKLEIDTYYDTLINPRLHYHAFALFDYLQVVKNPPFDIRQLPFEVTNATGQVKEIGYSYQQERRGLVSNAIYLACVLYQAGNISDLEQACKMLEYVISHMYPNGGHIHPIDGWSNNDNVISGTPLESQALIETILS